MRHLQTKHDLLAAGLNRPPVRWLLLLVLHGVPGIRHDHPLLACWHSAGDLQSSSSSNIIWERGRL